MALFDYLEGLTEALVKHDPFSKPDPCWEVFRVCVNYHPVTIEKNNMGARPCSPYELGWMRALGTEASGFPDMYERLTYCTSSALQDFIFQLHDDAELLVLKMQQRRGNAAFPDLIADEKDVSDDDDDDDDWSTDSGYASSLNGETSCA